MLKVDYTSNDNKYTKNYHQKVSSIDTIVFEVLVEFSLTTPLKGNVPLLAQSPGVPFSAQEFPTQSLCDQGTPTAAISHGVALNVATFNRRRLSTGNADVFSGIRESIAHAHGAAADAVALHHIRSLAPASSSMSFTYTIHARNKTHASSHLNMANMLTADDLKWRLNHNDIGGFASRNETITSVNLSTAILVGHDPHNTPETRPTVTSMEELIASFNKPEAVQLQDENFIIAMSASGAGVFLIIVALVALKVRSMLVLARDKHTQCLVLVPFSPHCCHVL